MGGEVYINQATQTDQSGDQANSEENTDRSGDQSNDDQSSDQQSSDQSSDQSANQQEDTSSVFLRQTWQLRDQTLLFTIRQVAQR